MGNNRSKGEKKREKNVEAKKEKKVERREKESRQHKAKSNKTKPEERPSSRHHSTPLATLLLPGCALRGQGHLVAAASPRAAGDASAMHNNGRERGTKGIEREDADGQC